MESNSVRRSSRRSGGKKPVYKEGDIVKVQIGNNNSHVQLLSKLTDTSQSPRWLVSSYSPNGHDNHSDGDENKSWSQEEIDESAFGSIIGKTEVPLKEVTKRTSRKRQTNESRANGIIATTAVKQSSPVSVSSNNGEEDISKSNGKKKRKSSGDEFQLPPSDSSVVPQGRSNEATKRSAAAQAREERSKRRQALLDEENKIDTLSVRSSPSGRNSGSNNNGTTNKKQKVKNTNNNTNNNTNKEVIRVALLTGTLYLYRGRRRRAEFVPKV